jgi:hypothetical protein
MSLLSNWLNKKEKECERLKEMDFEEFWARKKVNEILNFSRRLFFLEQSWLHHFGRHTDIQSVKLAFATLLLDCFVQI